MTEIDDTEQVRVKYVRITNGLDIPWTDMHDGVPVRVDPGESQNLPIDMAAHFFGFAPNVSTEVMFKHVCKRQGWNTPEFLREDPVTRKTKAREFFEKLVIEPRLYKLTRVDPDPTEPIPADPLPVEKDVAAPRAPRRVEVRV